MDAPRGQQAVRAALIEAAADLLAAKSNVSVREIATRANVNHGLVHHYFGGKEQLEREVLEYLASQQHELLANAVRTPRDLLEAAIDVARADDRFWRVLGRMLLDGRPIDRIQSAFPVVRRLIEALEASGVAEARILVAEGLASVLGWMMYDRWIRRATGLSDEEATAAFESTLRGRISAMLGSNEGKS